MSNPVESKTEISYAVSGITLLSSFIDNSIEINVSKEKIVYKISGETKADIPNKLLNITLECVFTIGERRVLEMRALNSFRLRNISDEMLGSVSNNSEFIKHLIEISLHHMRGLQSTLIKGTGLEKFYLPINPPLNINISPDKSP